MNPLVGLARLLRWRRRLPSAIRRWLPYWLLAAGVFAVPGIVGLAIGAKREAALILPVRRAGQAAVVPSAPELFVHNATLALQTAAGVLTFGLSAAWTLAFNGFALGGAVADAAGSLGPVATVALLAPHGVFELPAIWLAGAVAFRWTHVVWSVANGHSRDAALPRVVFRSLVAVGLVLLLLAVAAVVEATVTAALADVVS